MEKYLPVHEKENLSKDMRQLSFSFLSADYTQIYKNKRENRMYYVNVRLN